MLTLNESYFIMNLWILLFVLLQLANLRIIADLPINYGIIVEIDDKGNIVQSLQSPSGKIARISEVLEHNGYLYLGSWRNRFLGRLKL